MSLSQALRPAITRVLNSDSGGSFTPSNIAGLGLWFDSTDSLTVLNF